MLSSLAIVRHGESQWNSLRRIQGQTESPLSDEGRKQARALNAMLGDVEFHAVYSSDLSRAAETALLGSGWDADQVVFTPKLREISFGRWEGMTSDDVKRNFPEEWEAFRRDPINHRPDTGETTEQLSARCQELLDMWHDRHEGEDIIAFTHGGPARMLLIITLGLPLDRWRTLRIANTGLTRIQFIDGVAQLECFDVTSHLLSVDYLEQSGVIKSDED